MLRLTRNTTTTRTIPIHCTIRHQHWCIGFEFGQNENESSKGEEEEEEVCITNMTSKPKLAFSIKDSNKKKQKTDNAVCTEETKTVEGFEAIHDKPEEEPLVHPDLQGPLVIPALKDARQSLQEQARAKREQQQQESPGDDQIQQDSKPEESNLSKEDQEAIEALKREAGVGSSTRTNKRVIEAQENTFQNNGDKETDQLKEDLERHAPDLSVDSESYQKVPIADFGAALLRGMGWDGTSSTSDEPSGLPRPSRLGLGATPKLLDAPTHRKGRRRQDQVQRDQRLKEQQEEFQKQRELQILKDKQQTIQVGSIVDHENGRAIIRQWNGVPGLNMILVQFEGSSTPTKVKKGSVQLVSRQALHERPFQELDYHPEETKYLGQEEGSREESENRRDKSRSRRDDNDDRRRDYRDEDRRRGEKRRYEEEEDDSRRRRDRSHDRSDRDRRRSSDDRRSSRRDDEGDDYDRHKRHKGSEHTSSSRREEKRPSLQKNDRSRAPQTWLTPNIRVRVITSKFGRSHDKRKGVVVDVTTSKGATLKMETGEILQVPERYLETALPKVGGNAIILTGNHKFGKGRLLERDSRANKGAVQLFEDMNIVNTSLDDIAEWCGPLDDDLMD